MELQERELRYESKTISCIWFLEIVKLVFWDSDYFKLSEE